MRGKQPQPAWLCLPQACFSFYFYGFVFFFFLSNVKFFGVCFPHPAPVTPHPPHPLSQPQNLSSKALAPSLDEGSPVSFGRQGKPPGCGKRCSRVLQSCWVLDGRTEGRWWGGPPAGVGISSVSQSSPRLAELLPAASICALFIEANVKAFYKYRGWEEGFSGAAGVAWALSLHRVSLQCRLPACSRAGRRQRVQAG